MLGKAIGHILPGVIFLGVGLWHLINHISLFFSLGPASYVAPAWFPAAPYPAGVLRYLELIAMASGSVVGIAVQHIVLLIMSWKPPPSSSSDADGGGSLLVVPFKVHEHDVFFATVIIYAVCATHLDRVRHAHAHQQQGRRTLCTLLLAVVFAQELFIFSVHSSSTTDHDQLHGAGVEWQFHWLLRAIISVSLATALLGAGYPKSFAVSVVRSVSMVFQGVWFVVVGVKFVPSMVEDGCSVEADDAVGDTMVYRCHSEASEHHAKAVANLQFAWCLALVTLFVVGVYCYLMMSRNYPASAAAVVETPTCGGYYTYGRLPPAEATDESDGLIMKQQAVGGIGGGGGDVHEFTPMQIEV